MIINLPRKMADLLFNEEKGASHVKHITLIL
jgi:hypothetical protein